MRPRCFPRMRWAAAAWLGLYLPAYLARGARQVVPESAGFDPAEFLDLCDQLNLDAILEPLKS